MNAARVSEAGVLRLTLHDALVGYLAGHDDGHNVLVFADEFKRDPQRPTFSLTTHPDFPNAAKVMSKPRSTSVRLHPILSNLLPEGVLREWMTQQLGVHLDNEFQLFAHLGQDLPGALVATPMEPDEVPGNVLGARGRARAFSPLQRAGGSGFSLAGVQMKFSMTERDGRYAIPATGALGDWIVKTPSHQYRQVPLNEYTAMKLAALAGVDVPDIRLVDVDQLDILPTIDLPDEKHALAISRFDRNGGERIHMEDFAQVLAKYPHEKYGSASYEQIGAVTYQYSGDGQADVQQLARRLLVNILLANGDAHLKNWSLVYPDRRTPRLSPAYDIVTTRAYIGDETTSALNLDKTRQWYSMTTENIQRWAERTGVPWQVVRPHLDDVMERARTLWPRALDDLPMADAHKRVLTEHWSNLDADFRIEAS